MEETTERFDDVIPCGQMDGFHLQTPEHHGSLFDLFLAECSVQVSVVATGGVYHDGFTGFRISEAEQAHVGDFGLTSVADHDGDDVVFFTGDSQCFFKTIVLKITDQKDDRAAFARSVQMFDGGSQVGAGSDRLAVQQFANDSQHVSRPRSWWKALLDVIGKQRDADLVLIANGRNRQRGSQFGDQFPLGLRLATEVLRGAQVDQQHHRHLAFFTKELDERLVATCGDIPIDRANIVTDLVGANFFKFDSSALESRMPRPGQQIVDLVRAANLDLSNFLKNFRGDHASYKIA